MSVTKCSKYYSFENMRAHSRIHKNLILLALPIMGTNFLQTLYNLADTYFLGRLGKEELSAPSVSFNIIFFLILFGSGFAMAGTTLISQAKGRGDSDRVDFYASQTFTVILAMSVVISLLGIVFTEPVLKLLQVPAELMGLASVYLRLIFIGMPFMFISFVFRAVLQGIGDSMTPLILQLITVVLNIVLDPIFIFGLGPVPAMGVKGAAIATVLSRSVNSIISLFILVSGNKGVRLRLSYMVPQMEALRKLVSIGLPSSIGGSVAALGFTVLQGIVNTFGASVIAAFGISGRIIALFNMPAQGISQATAVMVGQYLGAKDSDGASHVVRFGVETISVFIVIGMSITFFFGNLVTGFFINEPEVIAYGAELFRVVSISVVFFSLFTVINGAFQGGGDTRPIMVFNIIRLWGIRVPLAYILSTTLGMGPSGIWWAMFLSNFVVSIANFILYSTGRWKYRLDPDTI